MRRVKVISKLLAEIDVAKVAMNFQVRVLRRSHARWAGDLPLPFGKREHMTSQLMSHCPRPREGGEVEERE